MREQLNLMEAEQRKFVEIVSSVTDQNEKDVENLIIQRKVLNSRDALEFQLVTEIRDLTLPRDMIIEYIHDDFYVQVVNPLNPNELV